MQANGVFNRVVKKCGGYEVGVRLRECRGDQIRNFDQMIEVGFAAFASVVCVSFGGVMGGVENLLNGFHLY